MAQKLSYQDIAADIVQLVGGAENVMSLTHCITRLRFKLKDEGLADTQALKNHDAVVTVMQSGGQYQVVIGNDVADVYAEVEPLLNVSSEDTEDAPKEGNLLTRFVDVVSAIFQPILGLMAACGMLKGLNLLFNNLGWYEQSSGIYIILGAIGDGLFMFLPVFLGYTAASKFGLKPMLGMLIGIIMCFPTIQASALSADGSPISTLFADTPYATDVYMSFLGIPVVSMDYTSTVIPVIFVVYAASYIARFFDRVIPDLVKFFFSPMLTLLVAVPLGLLLIGPVAALGSSAIADLVISLRDVSPLLAGLLVGLTWQILVIFGLHWGFIPVYINNIVTNGYDNVMMPFFACTFATSAVVLGVFFKTKDKKIKQLCMPNFISGIFGVTEPAIYGILLPLKKPLYISCIAGGIGGAFYGAMNFRKFVMGGMGIFEFPGMMNPDGSPDNLYVAFAGVAISMLSGFILTMLFYKESPQEVEAETTLAQAVEDESAALEEFEVLSPVNGTVLPLSEVKDAAFAGGKLGKGVAIDPSDGHFLSPVDGTIITVFPTLHAIAIKADSGAQILLHIGMNTVELKGKGFNCHVSRGDQVQAGQSLVDVDLEVVRAAGYSTTTPLVLVNHAQHQITDELEQEHFNIEAGQTLFHTIDSKGTANVS
ncbi:beta-glucoside-specific PTS transporter subunit IIABC [Corynebacterium pelargi]|uniref:PTS system beta-glucoside-specific EIIBCA component n=1 Tax=Corynebacterium pelargi TaxID=1471400 RepID=A0A410W700_9CORY|nr:beta-glucoside-specific PTS transporter subunit IIABC [Corynebacterium pelargi]QAU51743.1 PTS system beta-glucoside-specific EIIBCA component [Corynebacterium pelargi]GGG80913.1 PTS beta-glucoside transporter subunit EIIBCA [Corynebacterium pelargi]